VVRRLFFSRAKKTRGANLGLFDQTGPIRFWQHRFYDFNVWSERKRIEKLRYIHRNPVTRGLVHAPDQWKWSSYRFYAYQEVGLIRVDDWSVLPRKDRAA
jgi:putative transposase